MDRRAARRRDRLVRESCHDPYDAKAKLPDPTRCPDCRAVFRQGRWSWAPGPFDAPQARCPACRRSRDRYPSGEVRMSGAFTEDHRGELLGLVHNVEARERERHPLKRIMEVREGPAETVVATTDPRLARAIGEALCHAYGGELNYRYAEEEAFLRVRWERV